MADEEVTTELALPGMELPEYHGRRPSKSKFSVSGTGNKVVHAHSIGDRVIAVVELKVKEAGHGLDGDELVYAEKLSTTDFFEIQGAPGVRLLSAVRAAYRAATEGAESLLGAMGTEEGASGRTDASGIVVTPGDTMGLEDDSLVGALTDASKTPVVVIYSDGGRELWPDDFDSGDPRPAIGSVVLDEHAVESVVVKILDAVTGETLEEWTDEQENARLLAMETTLERGEALARFEELRDAMAAGPLPDDEATEYAELLARFQGEAADDRAVMEEILPEGAIGDPTPLDQVDPPEANEDLTADPAEAFPGYAGDGPDDELVIADGDEEPSGAPAEPEAPAPDLEVAPPAEGPTPGGDDFLAVDRDLSDLKEWIKGEEDRDTILRWLAAEEAGRGRKLKPRKGALDALSKRAAELFTDEGFSAPDLPPTGAGFEPPEGSDEWED